MTDPAHDAKLLALEAALARLAPPPDPLNRDRLLFRAGQASARRHRWAWPCATAASLLLSVALGVALAWRPEPPPAERVVYRHTGLPAPAAVPLPLPEEKPSAADVSPAAPRDLGRGEEEAGYLQFRRQVLAHGPDALPAPTPWRASPPRGDLDTLLGLPPGASRGSWPLHLRNPPQSGDAS